MDTSHTDIFTPGTIMVRQANTDTHNITAVITNWEEAEVDITAEVASRDWCPWIRLDTMIARNPEWVTKKTKRCNSCSLNYFQTRGRPRLVGGRRDSQD